MFLLYFTLAFAAFSTHPVSGTPAAQGGCQPSWSATFGPLPGIPDGSGNVRALATFDDSGGQALYLAGTFTVAGSTVANRIAKWDSENWSTLGSGLNGTVNALVVFDDGGGPALYAGGYFELGGTLDGLVGIPRIAKWDGTVLSPIGNGLDGPICS